MLEWLHHLCNGDLSAGFLNFSVGDFLFQILFQKGFKILFSWLWRRDPVLDLLVCIEASARHEAM